jgi:hypothetical protein
MDKPRRLAGSPWADIVTDGRGQANVVVPQPSAEDLQAARNYLAVEVPLDSPPQPIEALRKFFRPLPRGKIIQLSEGGASIHWPKHLDGMSPENIAMFLMIPHFIYSNYEENKTKHRQVFVTPDEALHRSEHKLPPSILPPDKRASDFSVTHVGTEIVREAEPIVIHIEAIPAEKHWRKIPPAPELVQALKDAKGQELKMLTVKWNDKHGGLDPEELSSARTRQYRKITKLKDEVEKYNKLQQVDKPGTGRIAYDILIPPCPEGAQFNFRLTEIRKYIDGALNPPLREATDPEESDKDRITPSFGVAWDFIYSQFENKVIHLAFQKELMRGWPNLAARTEWVADGCPIPPPKFYGNFENRGTHNFEKDFQEYLGSEFDETAKNNAWQGYERGELGEVRDESIRHVGPRTQMGWHSDASTRGFRVDGIDEDRQ